MAGIAGSYELGRFSGVCAASGSVIAPGNHFVAALVDRVGDDGHPTLARLDYSIGGWGSAERPAGLVSFWQSTAPQPGERRHIFVDDETLLEMVQRMETEDDTRRKAFRWVLALALLRRKALRLEGIEQLDGVESWLFRPRGAEEGSQSIRIANPGIRDEELGDLAEQLSDVIRPDGE